MQSVNPPVVNPVPEKAPKKAASKTVVQKYKAPEASSELFGVKGLEKNIEMLLPKSESDFLEYAKTISHGLKPFEKSYHYIALLKTIMRLSMTNMKAADTEDVASSITAIANEILKAEKQAVAGKKKMGGKKKQPIVDKPDDNLVAGPYGPMDDYDYM
ncbi:unnamed protein product [Arabidopsis lyrata]|nr:unnamed protein product [Arabidopsis lyrata]